MSQKITMNQADEIIQASKYADMVEEYEANEAGHVYGLEDGSAVVVDLEGNLTHHPAE